MSNSKCFVPFLLCAITWISGCETTSQPDYGPLGLVEVSGVVSLDNKPLSNAEIRFETVADGIYSYGHTDENGRYKLMFDSRKSGIIPGKKRVMVLEKRKSESESTKRDREEGEDPEEMVENVKIPACYGRASAIEVEVKGAETSFDFNLKTDCSTTSRN
jgi:hypothetical protein